MKKKIQYLLALPLLSTFLIAEVNNLSGKDGLLAKSPVPTFDYPYIVDDANTISIVPNSATQDSVKIALTVYDNEDQDFYNNANNRTVAWLDGGAPAGNSSLTLLSEESNIDSNQYIFSTKNNSFQTDSEYQIASLSSLGVKYEENGKYLISTLYVDGQPGVTKTDKTLETIQDVRFTTASDTMDSYPEIYADDINGENSVYNIAYEGNEITFQISGENLENTPDGNLNVVLKDSEGVYSTYTATSTDISTNTYSISGLTDSSYEFVSVINSDLTIDTDGNNIAYTPTSTVSFIDDLGMDETELTIARPTSYITNGGFTITDSATVSSIQFTLNVVDNGANDFENSLIANDNILDVTMSEDGNIATTYEATWQGDSANDIYTFEINNLDPVTNYEIISLDNTGLSLYSSDATIDNKISIVDDLQADGNFTTTDGEEIVIVDDSFNFLWLILPVILVIFIIGGWFLFHKNKEKQNDQKSKLRGT